jgi:hypothetical protein
LAKVGETAYKLLLPEGCKLHPTFHVSQLKKHIGNKVVPSPDLPLVDDAGNVKVFLETILQRRAIPRNNEPVAQWLIKWVNLPAIAATWEDATYIQAVFPSFHTCGQVWTSEGGNCHDHAEITEEHNSSQQHLFVCQLTDGPDVCIPLRR